MGHASILDAVGTMFELLRRALRSASLGTATNHIRELERFMMWRVFYEGGGCLFVCDEMYHMGACLFAMRCTTWPVAIPERRQELQGQRFEAGVASGPGQQELGLLAGSVSHGQPLARYRQVHAWQAPDVRDQGGMGPCGRHSTLASMGRVNADSNPRILKSGK